MTLKSRNKVSANFNMSSMTDIIFLLLIFFMLTSTLISPNALDLLLPSSKSQTVEKQTISVEIQKDEKTEEIRFSINTEKTSLIDLENKLINILKNEQDPSLVLYADKTIAIDHVVKVLEIANRNNYKVVLATDPN